MTYINTINNAECVEYWRDKNILKRMAFLKTHGDFANIKVEHITLIEYIKNKGFIK